MNSLPGFNHSVYTYNFTEKQMRYYFEPPPVRPIKKLLILLILYFLLALGSLVVFSLEIPRLFSLIQTHTTASSTDFITPGSMLILFILLIVFGWRCYISWINFQYEWSEYSEEKKHTPPTEDEYQAWLDERYFDLYEKAKRKLRLVRSESELSLIGGIFPSEEDKRPLVRSLRNRRWHSSLNVCKYVFLTKDNMKVFSSEIDALHQKNRNESSSHYFYEHIVSVSFEEIIQPFKFENPPELKFIKRQYFSFAIDNGDYISPNIMSASLQSPQGDFNDLEEIVANFLMLLRDHKVSRVEVHHP
jgi:hypothetical protein